MAQGTETVKVCTSAGKQAKCNRVIGTADAAFTYIALGTGNTNNAAVADTTLTTETSATGLARAAATCSASSGVVTWSKTFTNASGSTVVISELGILNAASNGTLLIHITLGTDNFISLIDGDSFIVTITDAE